MISVVIPTFNRAKAVVIAVQSVMSQTIRPLEIIIVDDCSSDDTWDVLLNISSKTNIVRIFRLEKNLGGSGARNFGIDQALGRFIAFLDCDDIWLPQHLEFHLLAADREPSGIYASSLIRLNHKAKILPDKLLFNSLDFSKSNSYLLSTPLAFQSSTLFMSSEIARSIRFDARLRRHQDWDFILRANRLGVNLIISSNPSVIYISPPKKNGFNVGVSVEIYPSFRFLAKHRSYLGWGDRIRFLVLQIERRRSSRGRLLALLIFAFCCRAIRFKELAFYVYETLSLNDNVYNHRSHKLTV